MCATKRAEKRHAAPSIGAAVVAVSLAAAGCAPFAGDGPPAKPPRGGPTASEPVPRAEPRSRGGNPPFYEVFGKRYHVMAESRGYRERGVASWYGSKFHGRPTASGEIYDMHQFTAAHKSLPLPTFARVTNLRNGRSVIVRINDRGPFVNNRIIDLSYAAAGRLDMINDGTSLVEVVAIDAGETDNTTIAEPPPNEPPGNLFVQVGAFSEPANADRMLARLRNNGFANALIRSDNQAEPPLFRVRVGPVGDVAEFDSVVERLRELGLDGARLAVE